MNILKDLLLSSKGKIGRADFIYGITFNILLFLISIHIFLNIQPVFLIGGGFDITVLVMYVLSLFGLAYCIWSYYCVVSKRFFTVQKPHWMTYLTYIFPPLLAFGFQKDIVNISCEQKISFIDTIFFYFLLCIILLCVFVFFKLEIFQKIFLSICVIIFGICMAIFSYDKKQFNTTEKKKYVGIDSWIDLGFVLILVFFIRIYVITPFQIIGPSMESTFHGGKEVYDGQRRKVFSDGEYILVDKMTYKFHTPKRGDVVVFTPGVGPKKRYLIKRIIGLPGDSIKIENGYVHIATKEKPNLYIQIDESRYLEEKYGYTCVNYNDIDCKNNNYVFHVPEGKYFLLGDNRLKSLDARKCFNNSGCNEETSKAQFLPASRIQGRVAYSLGHFDMFSRFLPYPKLGTLKIVVPYRGFSIKNSHEYREIFQ